MLIATQRFIERTSIWLLQNVAQPMNMQAAVERFRPAVDALAGELSGAIPESLRSALEQRAQHFVSMKAPQKLAERIASLDALAAAGDIVLLAEAQRSGIVDTGRLYFAVGARLGLDWLLEAAASLPQEGNWGRQAANAIGDDMIAAQRNLTASVLAETAGDLEAWTARRKGALERHEGLLVEMRAGGPPDLSALAVAAHELRNIERPV